MGYVLQAARNQLRTDYETTHPGLVPANWVGIQLRGMPPRRAGDWYVALDEDYIRGKKDQAHIEEVYGVSIYVCRRPDKLPDDFRGQLTYPDDVYLATMLTLEKMERQVLKSIHNNQTMRAAANTLGGFPAADKGDSYQLPLQYDGRGSIQTSDVPDSGMWSCREMKFSGMLRVQALDILG